MKNALVTLFALLSISAFAADNSDSNKSDTPASAPASKVVVHKAKKKNSKSKQKVSKTSPAAQPATPVSQ